MIKQFYEVKNRNVVTLLFIERNENLITYQRKYCHKESFHSEPLITFMRMIKLILCLDTANDRVLVVSSNE